MTIVLLVGAGAAVALLGHRLALRLPERDGWRGDALFVLFVVLVALPLLALAGMRRIADRLADIAGPRRDARQPATSDEGPADNAINQASPM